MSRDPEPLHGPSADVSEDRPADMEKKIEQLQAICQQLEEVRVQAEALRERISQEMSESSRRERFQPTHQTARAADTVRSE